MTEAQKWTYLARWKGINFEAQPEKLRAELEEIEKSARQMTFNYPKDIQMVNKDMFAMMLFDTGFELLDKKELQEILSSGSVDMDVMEFYNVKALQAGATALLENHSKQYLSRAHALNRYLKDAGPLSPEVIQHGTYNTECIPCPLVLARHMVPADLVEDACDFAKAISAQGIPTQAEVILQIAMTKGMRDDGEGGLYDTWEKAAKDILDRPAARTIAEPILRSGLSSLRKWDATVGISAHIGVFEHLFGFDHPHQG